MVIRANSNAALLVLFSAGLASCGGGSGKTVALPADGGELAKAYAEMADAFKAGDRDRAGKRLDEVDRYTNGVDGSGLAKYANDLSQLRPVGGRQRGDRAALFLAAPNQAAAGHPERPAQCFQTLDATHTADGWKFDDIPAPAGCDDERRKTECPRRVSFPCSVATAPDAQVWGSIQEPGGRGPKRTVTLTDGLAVRMIDFESNRLKSVRVALTSSGVVPQEIPYLSYPDDLNFFTLSRTVLVLDVAPDGKSALAKYRNPWDDTEMQLSGDGFDIDTTNPGRVHGQLKLKAQQIGTIDIAFDVATVSECADKYGNSCL